MAQLQTTAVTGSLTVTQGITGSLLGTASWASNALSANTSSYVLNAVSASYALSSSYAVNATNAVNATSALTASSADNFTVRGTLTAQTIVAQTITSSTSWITGSTKFGSLTSNTHQFTGSIYQSGSEAVFNIIKVSDGSSTAPSYTFSNSTNTGLYLISAGRPSITANGVSIFNAVSNSFAEFTNVPRVLFPGGSVSLPGIQFGSDQDTGIYNPTDGVVAFSANGSNTVYIKADGNVGIGTTNPSSKLDVQGAISLGAVALPSAGVARIFLRNTDSNLYIQTSTGNNIYLLDGSQNSMYAVNPTSHSWLISNSTKMTLDSNGNLIIGSTVANPVASTSKAALTLRKFTSGNASTVISASYYIGVGGNEYTNGSYRLIGFGYAETSATTTYPAYIGYIERSTVGYTYGDLIFGTRNTTGASDNPTERMRIQNDGNVGIGSTAPGSKLDVYSTDATVSRIYNNQTSAVFEFGSANNTLYSDITLKSNSGQAEIWKSGTGYTSYGGALALNIYNSNAGIHFFPNGTGTSVMAITGSSVGISTTAPAYKLDVIGAIASNTGTNEAQVFVRNSTSAIYLFNSYAGNTFGLYDGTAGQHRIYYDRNSSFWAIYTGASERMRIDSSGNVGIGTTNPTTLLEVKKANNDEWIAKFINTGTTPYGVSIDTSANSSTTYTFAAYTANGSGFYVVNNGNVGVGNGSPSAKLQISGDGSAFNQLRINHNGSGTNGFLDFNITDTRAIITTNYSSTNIPLEIKSYGNTNQIFLATNGNVGISTSSPNVKFEVASTTMTGSEISVYTTNTSGGDSTRYAFWRNYTIGGSSPFRAAYISNINWDDSFSASNRQDLGFYTKTGTAEPTQKMVITGAGNIGIGTTTPSSLLQVYSTSGSPQGITITGGDETFVKFIQGPGGVKNWGLITTNLAVSDFGIYQSNAAGGDPFSAGTARLYFNADGNVGIGTTSPGYNLQVGNTGANYNVAVIGSTTAGIEIRTNSAGGRIAALEQYFGAEGSLWLYLSNSTKVLLRADGASYLNGGNVGIGTTSPASTLDIGRNQTTPALMIVNNQYAGAYSSVWGLQSGAQSIMIFGNNGQNEIRAGNTAAGGYLDFYTNNSAAYTATSNGNFTMRLSSNGYVGIGTTNPNTRLVVIGTSGNPGLEFDNGSTYTYIQSYDRVASAHKDLYFYTTGAPTVIFNTGGNVGIGTTSPGYKLDVIAASTSDGLIVRQGGNRKFLANGDGVVYWGADIDYGYLTWDTGKAVMGGQSGKALELRANNTLAMYINTSGNVGIGTTAPQNLLHVRAGASGLASYDSRYKMILENNGEAYFLVTVPDNSYGGMRIAGTGAAAKAAIEYYMTDNLLHMYSTGSARLYTGGNLTMFINTAGSVGIGTTAPAYQLHVLNNIGLRANNVNFQALKGTGWGYSVSGYKVVMVGDNVTTNYTTVSIGYDPSGNPNGAFSGDGREILFRRGAQFVTPNAADNSFYLTNLVLRDGNVGIGSATPGYTLDVVGSLKTTAGTYLGTDSSNVIVGGTTSDVIASFKFISIGNAAFQYGASTGNYLRIEPGAANTEIAIKADARSGAWPPLAFFTTNSERMRINADGNVGIGTTNPYGGKLHLYNTTGIIEGPSNGNTGINSNVYALQIGPLHDRSTTTNTYYPGIAFNHLLNYAGTTSYNGAPQAWVGLRLYDTAGSERSYLTFATKPGTGTTGTGNDIPIERMCIDPINGNVGIGTTNPTARLHAYGTETSPSLTTNTGIFTVHSTSTVQLNIGGNNSAPYPIWLQTRDTSGGSNVYPLLLNPLGGNVGIGTTNPAYKLDVAGTIRATGDVIAYSDARVKDNVTTVENALEKVKSLRGVNYTRKDDETKALKVGVIAQEVLEVLPEVVQQDDQGNYSVAYGNMVGVLIEAIKEQQRQIEDLKYLLSQK